MMPIIFKRYKRSLKFGQVIRNCKSNIHYLKVYQIYQEIKKTATEIKT